MLTSGKSLAEVLQPLEISEATYHRWRNQYGGMKSNEAKRLKEPKKAITELLSDLKRSGRPPRITPAQQADLAAKACEDPQDSGRPSSHCRLAIRSASIWRTPRHWGSEQPAGC